MVATRYGCATVAHADIRGLGAHKRKNWLFIGSQLAGERAAVVMSLLQSAKLNGHEPWAYLKDVLTRGGSGCPNAELASISGALRV